jgi:FKBP-type peptidyl-prolyl cis-trans isomerase (trigger factor)
LLISKKFKEGDKKNLSFNLSKILKNDKLNKVEYSIEVVSIEESVKFEITDEYLSKNGFKNENELKDILKNNSIQQYNQGIKQIEKKQLMDFLNKDYKFDLPEGVLEEDFNEIWNRLENAKKDGTLDEDDKSLSENELKKRYKKISERRVKLGVLLQYIAKEEKISISEDELSKGIMQYASQYPGQETQIMEYLKKNPSSVESIRGPMLEDKIINVITSKASIINKKINEQDYKKLEEETFDIKRN